ncbi:hypothetical protein BCR15_10545 [Tessaracoccus lapidicaptus]|uniref:Uncharacterized protein n=1 Tax=Tessaracoccus lapidicaptus TaxID=1427523 RepID=A0A1C0AGQ1_9ACTN|nr:hypothetical protein BCR15_10545 [Tessaracoccus lapidicaptus]
MGRGAAGSHQALGQEHADGESVLACRGDGLDVVGSIVVGDQWAEVEQVEGPPGGWHAMGWSGRSAGRQYWTRCWSVTWSVSVRLVGSTTFL